MRIPENSPCCTTCTYNTQKTPTLQPYHALSFHILLLRSLLDHSFLLIVPLTLPHILCAASLITTARRILPIIRLRQIQNLGCSTHMAQTNCARVFVFRHLLISTDTTLRKLLPVAVVRWSFPFRLCLPLSTVQRLLPTGQQRSLRSLRTSLPILPDGIRTAALQR